MAAIRDFPKTGKRWVALGMSLLGYTEMDIQRETGLQPKAQRLWRQRFADTGDVHDALGAGRRTDREDAIRDNKRKIRELTEAESEMANSARKMSTVTDVGPRQVLRYLHDPDLTSGYAGQETKPQHNREHLRKRLAFARRNARRGWTKVVFSDSKICVGDITPAKAKWKLWHPPARRRRPVHVKKHSAYQVHVYGAMTVHGAAHLVEVTGTSKRVSRFFHVYGLKVGGA